MKRVSGLEEARKYPGRYIWGPVVAFHKIGRYDFIEHRVRKVEGITITYELEPDITEFSIFVDGRSIGQGADTLERAIVTAIAYKFDGCNSLAASYFDLMVKGLGRDRMEDEEK